MILSEMIVAVPDEFPNGRSMHGDDFSISLPCLPVISSSIPSAQRKDILRATSLFHFPKDAFVRRIESAEHNI